MTERQSTAQPTKEQMFDSLVESANTLSDYHLEQFFAGLGYELDAGRFCGMLLCQGKSKEEAILLTLQRIHEKVQKPS